MTRAADVACIELPGTVPDAWLDLAHAVYADDPAWIPENRATLRAELSVDNPWFASRRARAFLVPGKVRAAAFFDRDMHVDGEVVACFGDFVTTGDAQAERALLEAVAEWARGQGAGTLLGPIHMSTYHSYRALLSKEPSGLPFPGEPYNSAAVPRALERCGFEIAQRYQTHLYPRSGMRTMIERVRPAARRAADAGYVVRVLPRAQMQALLPDFYERNSAIFRGNYAWSPVPKAVWVRSVAKLLERACPHTCALAWSPASDLVGFCINTPHWGALTVQGADPRFEVDELRYEDHVQLLGPKRALVVKSIGVSPEHRDAGVAAQLLEVVFENALQHYEQAIGALMREDNKSRRFGEGAYDGERWYALYRRALQPSRDQGAQS